MIIVIIEKKNIIMVFNKQALHIGNHLEGRWRCVVERFIIVFLASNS